MGRAARGWVREGSREGARLGLLTTTPPGLRTRPEHSQSTVGPSQDLGRVETRRLPTAGSQALPATGGALQFCFSKAFASAKWRC